MNIDVKKKLIELLATILILALLGTIDGWSMITAAIGAVLLGFCFVPIFRKRWQRCFMWLVTLSVGLLAMNYFSMALEDWLKDNQPLAIFGDYVYYLMETGKSAIALIDGSKDLVDNQNPDFLTAAGANLGFLFLSLALPIGLVVWAIKNPEKDGA